MDQKKYLLKMMFDHSMQKKIKYLKFEFECPEIDEIKKCESD